MMDAKPQHNYDVSINSADCPGCVWEHQQYIKQTVPAPQQPADATPKHPFLGHSADAIRCAISFDGGKTECGMFRGDSIHIVVVAARPPVTGDGDAAELDRLVEDAVMSMNVRPYHSTRQAMDNLAYEAYAAGIARGRELGAREERADIIRDAHESHCYCCPGRPRCPICEFADAIEARRAGRTP
jgi:hypothetical protein